MVSIWANFAVTLFIIIIRAYCFIILTFFKELLEMTLTYRMICEIVCVPFIYFVFSPEIRGRHWSFMSYIKSKLYPSNAPFIPIRMNVQSVQSEENIISSLDNRLILCPSNTIINPMRINVAPVQTDENISSLTHECSSNTMITSPSQTDPNEQTNY